MIIIDRHMTMPNHVPGIQSNDDRYARFRAKYPAPRANNHPWPHLTRDRMPEWLKKESK